MEKLFKRTDLSPYEKVAKFAKLIKDRKFAYQTSKKNQPELHFYVHHDALIDDRRYFLISTHETGEIANYNAIALYIYENETDAYLSNIEKIAGFTGRELIKIAEDIAHDFGCKRVLLYDGSHILCPMNSKKISFSFLQILKGKTATYYQLNDYKLMINRQYTTGETPIADLELLMTRNIKTLDKWKVAPILANVEKICTKLQKNAITTEEYWCKFFNPDHVMTNENYNFAYDIYMELRHYRDLLLIIRTNFGGGSLRKAMYDLYEKNCYIFDDLMRTLSRLPFEIVYDSHSDELPEVKNIMYLTTLIDNYSWNGLYVKDIQ